MRTRIRAIETFRVSQRFMVCKVSTDDGLVGWGEPILESRAETVEAAVRELSQLLIGADPAPIERHRQVLVKAGFYRGGPVFGSAVAGLDQALWDLKGKALGVPVHELLGGPVRDRVRIYGPAHGDETEVMLDQARSLVEAGYTAVKVAPPRTLGFVDTQATVHGLIDRWTALRDEIGPGIDFAIDFHARVSAPMARVLLRHLEPLMPMFVEEPLPPEHQARIGELAAATTVPIATGERLYDRWDCDPVLRSGIAVLQPDVSHAGGISEVFRIAALAETHHVHLAPHCATGPVALAAGLQLDLAVPNVLIQESHLRLHRPGEHPMMRFVTEPDTLVFEDGYRRRPVGPGLGIELDEEALRAAAAAPDSTRSPVWSYPDGSYAEW
ncbi:galactonate dehydratase [Phytoactinopolyspora limicola]|uniref:galactonate dehydratase n=1 Tax=Phytoactinopolyspora limicola TaxID=2715536 RepID=UPI001FE70869|nr:galactonate dehydratase [Phytoactinopolyspora limicola]